MSAVAITNHGPLIVSTNYWSLAMAGPDREHFTAPELFRRISVEWVVATPKATMLPVGVGVVGHTITEDFTQMDGFFKPHAANASRTVYQQNFAGRCPQMDTGSRFAV